MRRRLQHLRRDQSGVALVIALIMMILLTLIGLASTFSSTYETKLSGNKRGSTDAFYSADSGIELTVADVTNFELPGKYKDDKYKATVDASKTNAQVVIENYPSESAAPKGLGMSATGNYEFMHFSIQSTGQDQIELNPLRSNCTIQEKVVRLVPTLQGGN